VQFHGGIPGYIVGILWLQGTLHHHNYTTTGREKTAKPFPEIKIVRCREDNKKMILAKIARNTKERVMDSAKCKLKNAYL